MLLAAGGVLTFGLRWNGPLLRRVYIASVCALVVGDLYYGAVRTRVYGIGPPLFSTRRDINAESRAVNDNLNADKAGVRR